MRLLVEEEVVLMACKDLEVLSLNELLEFSGFFLTSVFCQLWFGIKNLTEIVSVFKMKAFSKIYKRDFIFSATVFPPRNIPRFVAAISDYLFGIE